MTECGPEGEGAYLAPLRPANAFVEHVIICTVFGISCE